MELQRLARWAALVISHILDIVISLLRAGPSGAQVPLFRPEVKSYGGQHLPALVAACLLEVVVVVVVLSE